jgi:effector-binding domain-containing protein
MTITYEIASRTLARELTAVIRGKLPPEELAGWLAGVFKTVHDYLLDSATEPVGPPFARYTFLADTVAVEAGFPVAGEIAGDGLVEPSALPGGTAAVIVHMGGYEDLDKAYAAVHDWLDAHGHVPAGPHWEVYVTDPTAEPDPHRWRTDIVVPYRAG